MIWSYKPVANSNYDVEKRFILITVQQRRQWHYCGVSILAIIALTGGARTWARRTDETANWKPAAAPLMTRFAHDVSPDKPRPEYPRPLMQRKEWQSLNGLWQFAFDDADTGGKSGWTTGKTLPERILVPFTFEAALSGIGKGREIHEHLWYRREFAVPSQWSGQRILLNFGAVDWQTTVYVNGKMVGEHVGGYTPFTCDITSALKTNGPQEVVVAVYDPADPKKEGKQPKGKQLGSEGIWYTRTTGIWQTVWLEPVAPVHIDRIILTPAYSEETHKGDLTLAANITGKQAVTLETVIAGKGQKATVTQTANPLQNPILHISLPNVSPWTPETPALYDITLRLKQNSKVIDEVKSYTAFRSVGIANGRLTLNGKPYFYRGVLDQGFWPDGIYTPPTDAAIKNDVEMAKKLGFNMARKHVKVEDPRWYYWCDKLGLAVWQDMPSSHSLTTPDARESFANEWIEVLADVHNNPCVVHWIPFNENWGDPQEFQDSIVRLTREFDTSRPITDASGWTQRGLTDVIDVHDYGNNLLRQGIANPIKPKVVGEYGGIALPVPGHTWTKGWGYQTVHDPAGLIDRVRFQTSQLFEAQNLSGFVYTQLTDVEQELNGLMTYDRLPKADVKRMGPVFKSK